MAKGPGRELRLIDGLYHQLYNVHVALVASKSWVHLHVEGVKLYLKSQEDVGCMTI